MYCPRCGLELTIFEEQMAIRWLYRMYPCPRCRVIWDWKSRIRGDNYWKLEECKAWGAVGIPIIRDYHEKHGRKLSYELARDSDEQEGEGR